MTDCPACTAAETNINHVIYIATRVACQARMLSTSPEAHSRTADPDALQRAMRATWPEVAHYRAGRLLLWEWIKRREAAIGAVDKQQGVRG